MMDHSFFSFIEVLKTLFNNIVQDLQFLTIILSFCYTWSITTVREGLNKNINEFGGILHRKWWKMIKKNF